MIIITPGAVDDWHNALPSKPEVVALVGSNRSDFSGEQKSSERCSIGGMKLKKWSRVRSPLLPLHFTEP